MTLVAYTVQSAVSRFLQLIDRSVPFFLLRKFRESRPKMHLSRFPGISAILCFTSGGHGVQEEFKSGISHYKEPHEKRASDRDRHRVHFSRSLLVKWSNTRFHVLVPGPTCKPIHRVPRTTVVKYNYLHISPRTRMNTHSSWS